MQVNPLSSFQRDITLFEEIKKIGGGGEGIVYSVRQKETNKIYAAKVIFCSSSEYCQQIIDNEIRIMSYINHPTIIKFIGYSQLDLQNHQNATIIMEFSEKGDLSKILKQSHISIAPVDFSNTIRQIILIGIARGMKYLHDRNIIHGDLKPHNILLDDAYHPKITDFGFSRVFDYGKSMKTINGNGTLQYMAPEVIGGDGANRKSDVYSFGILMYEVVTDKEPYPNFNNIKNIDFRNGVYNNKLRPQFNDNSVKPSIRNLIERCWSGNKDERPTFKELFAKLSETKNYNDENNYLLDGANKQDIENYIDDISNIEDSIEELIFNKEKYEKENAKLKKENETKEKMISILQMENDIMKKFSSFSTFNCLPLKFQQVIVSKIITDFPESKSNQFYKNVNDILLFLLKNTNKDTNNMISIFSNNQKQLLSDDDNDDPQVHILSNTTEILYKRKLIKSNDFINLLKKFSIFSIELNYPSESFKEIYDIILNMREDYFSESQLQISIFILKIEPGDQQFKNNKNINYVKFSENVSTIERNFFEGCSSIKMIDFPSNLVKICEKSFKGCSSLTEIKIPANVTEIYSQAFSNCSNLYEISVRSNFETIESEIFEGCRCISLLSGIKIIPDNFFLKCQSIISIFIPASVKIIGSHCFDGCTNLAQIFIPSSVKTIGFYAFQDCSSLSQIFIPSSVEELSRFAFAGCKSLKKVELSPSIQQIENFLFSNCSSLQEINIPERIISIGDFAFSGCSSLKKVQLPLILESIGSFAFSECSELKKIEIPQSVREVDPCSFDNCHALSEIIYSSSTKIAENSFPSDVKLVKSD